MELTRRSLLNVLNLQQGSGRFVLVIVVEMQMRLLIVLLNQLLDQSSSFWDSSAHSFILDFLVNDVVLLDQQRIFQIGRAHV